MCLALSLQLLEDFRADSRVTVRRMAVCRRGSPVLRRITIALSTLCCRLEAPLRSVVESDARQQRLALLCSTYARAVNKIWPATRAVTVHPTLSSDFALRACVHPLPSKDLATPTTPLAQTGSADTLGKKRRGYSECCVKLE
jgi:hypothetical protein